MIATKDNSSNLWLKIPTSRRAVKTIQIYVDYKKFDDFEDRAVAEGYTKSEVFNLLMDKFINGEI